VLSKKERDRGQMRYTAIDTNFGGRYMRFGPATMAASYDNATEADKSFGYWGDTDNRLGTIFELGYIFW